MKIVTKDKTYDPAIEPIALIFDDDKERRNVIKYLVDIEDKEGERKYIQYPKGLTIEEVKEILKLKQ